MKSFNIRGGKDKADGAASPPKKGGAVPPAVKPGVPQPSGKGTEERKGGVLNPRAPVAPGGKKPLKQKAPREKTEREPRPVVEKNAKKLSPGMIAGIVALVAIGAVLLFLMKKPSENRQPPATQPAVSKAQKARMAMKREKGEESPFKAVRPAAPEPIIEEKPAPKSFLKTEKDIKSHAVPVVQEGRKKEIPRKAEMPAVKERQVEKPPARSVAKSSASEPISQKVTVKPRVTIKPKLTLMPRKSYETERENIAVKPLGPVEPGYLPPEPGSRVEEEFRRQTIFYMVLVEEADSREELRALANNMNLTTVSPEIREKSYGDRDVYWLTVGHYTREADAYNMAQVIRRMGYIAEVVSEKVYH